MWLVLVICLSSCLFEVCHFLPCRRMNAGVLGKYPDSPSSPLRVRFGPDSVARLADDLRPVGAFNARARHACLDTDNRCSPYGSLLQYSRMWERSPPPLCTALVSRRSERGEVASGSGPAGLRAENPLSRLAQSFERCWMFSCCSFCLLRYHYHCTRFLTYANLEDPPTVDHC